MTDYQTRLDIALNELHQNADSGIVQSVGDWLYAHMRLCLEQLSCTQTDNEVVLDLHKKSVLYRDLLHELDASFGEVE